MRRMLILACLLSLWSGTVYAAGNEARCTDLGVNCLCSEPLQGTELVLGGFAYNPNDTSGSDKECAVEGEAGGLIETNASNTYSFVTASTYVTMPATAQGGLKLLRSSVGDFGFTGHKYPTTVDGNPIVRESLRGYIAYDANHDWTGENACTNSGKTFQLGPPGPIFSIPILYSWNSGTPWTSDTAGQPADCCVAGPGDSTVLTGSLNFLKAKIHRWEFVVRNPTTTGQTILEVYLKNVTDNGPNYKVIDSSIPTAQAVGDQWTATIANSLSPPSRVVDIWFDLFRHPNCGGTSAMGFIMAAGWATDAGQLIGAATEIEGAGAQSYSTGISGVFRMQGMVTIR